MGFLYLGPGMGSNSVAGLSVNLAAIKTLNEWIFNKRPHGWLPSSGQGDLERGGGRGTAGFRAVFNIHLAYFAFEISSGPRHHQQAASVAAAEIA